MEQFGVTGADAHALAAVLNRGATGIVALWTERRGPRRKLVEAFVAMAEGAARALPSTARR
jgi:hypothetical protein